MRASVVVNCQRTLTSALLREVSQAADFGLQGVEIWDASSEALLLDDSQFDLRHVEPTAMFWGVVNLQLAN